MHRDWRRTVLLVAAFLTPTIVSHGARGVEYPYDTDEPQKSGWPLTEEETAYVLRAEHERRPGREANRHLPETWPVVPSAGFWGGRAWLDHHAGLVETAKASRGPIDVLLVGDSITQQWGDAWAANFPAWKTVNIGIGGDKTQNVLWRLDHGGVDGLEPKVCVLLIGNNNMFFTPETGVEPVAKGIGACVENLRERFPRAAVVVVKVFPAHAPGNPFYEDIRRVNAAIDSLDLGADPEVAVLDLWGEMVDADGSLKKNLFMPDGIHLSRAGYDLYAARLGPVIQAMLSGEATPAPPATEPRRSEARVTMASPLEPARSPGQPAAARSEVIDSKPVLRYAYAPYDDGRMDPQLTGWPLSAEELAWVSKAEYSRKPGHEVSRHLPEFWPITPSAAHWGKEGGVNPWLEKHAEGIERLRAMEGEVDIVLLGDSITQGWGGVEGPWCAAWAERFGDRKAVNLGLGGDRTESLLWRLDHGLLDGASPRVVVLMIGVNDANLVHSNGVPVSAAVEGIRLCVANVRLRTPDSRVVLLKILPAFDPARDVGARVREMNEGIDGLDLASDPMIRVLDPWGDFTDAEGALRSDLYADGHLHLGPDGYEVLAAKLGPGVEAVLGEHAASRSP